MREQLTFARILEAVAAAEGATVAELRGPSAVGNTEENWPRQRALLLARRLLPQLSWRRLSREMNGRGISCLAQQVATAERRYGASAEERRKVARLLDGLGLPPRLPPYDERLWRRARIGREIASTERQLARLKAELAQLEGHA
jgi:hypothetical protein